MTAPAVGLAQTARTVALVDPRTGCERGSGVLSRGTEVAGALARSRAASDRWAALPARERGRRLLGLAGALEGAAERFVLAEQAGTGKPEGEARAEVAEAADIFCFYAGACRSEVAPAAGERVLGYESWVRWEPLGVVGAVLPWNYPLMMAAWRCAPALAAGNTVVVKPAPSTPDSALLLEEATRETLGEDVLTVVTGDRDTGRLLVGGDLDAVAFTGSTRGGADVAARAGVRRVSLELGGNCPAVVLPDAPPSAWSRLAEAATYNAGQSCAAPARVIALRPHVEEVVSSLAAALRARRAGADFGPLNNPDQVARYDRLVGGSLARYRAVGPAEPAAGERGGFWRPACLLADLPDDDPAVVEEVFGPVLTVQGADDLRDALRLANSMPQALAASVWSSDVTSALTLARGLDAGEVWVNCHLVQTAELPHGGRRSSGNGTDLSILAMGEYARSKTTTVYVRS